jgi:hypothetical protein
MGIVGDGKPGQRDEAAPAVRYEVGVNVPCQTPILVALGDRQSQALTQFLVATLADILAAHDVDDVLGDIR